MLVASCVQVQWCNHKNRKTHFSSRVPHIALHEACEVLWEILRLANHMVFVRFVWHGICQVECLMSHVDGANASLPSFYGGQLGYICLVTRSGKLNFTRTVLKFSLVKMSFAWHAYYKSETHWLHWIQIRGTIHSNLWWIIRQSM